jgi:hypothetical protein
MAEIGLDGAGIDAVVGQLKPARVAEHVLLPFFFRLTCMVEARKSIASHVRSHSSEARRPCRYPTAWPLRDILTHENLSAVARVRERSVRRACIRAMWAASRPAMT